MQSRDETSSVRNGRRDGEHAAAAWSWQGYLRDLTPKSVIAARDGYSIGMLSADAMAGLTVAVLALPLSIAIAIAAGATPGQGLVTSVIAGFLISALGGSRYQIGGPAAAFIIVIIHIVERHGMAGMITTTFLAGVLLIIAGLAKLGTYVKYVPGPVIQGFTTGVGLLIALSQIKDFLGLPGSLPADAVPKVITLAELLPKTNVWAVAVGAFTLALIVGLKRWRPSLPGLLIAVVAGSALAYLSGGQVETIGSRFGGIPSSLPAPALPDLGWTRIVEVSGSAFTLAFLIGVESLLSAIAADAITGSRHRSNAEILGQGVANVASALFAGLPATGVIARTGTNIAAGAKTPVAGMLHAAFVLVFMLFAAPFASHLALPCLAAVLLNIAWRLIDARENASFLSRAPIDDRLIMLSTLLLTVFVELNVAIAVGVILGSLLLMHRMAGMAGVRVGDAAADMDVDGQPPMTGAASTRRHPMPDGIKVMDLSGPLVFATTTHLNEAMLKIEHWPKVLVLRMRDVPLIDSTAIDTLDMVARVARRKNCRIIMSGLQPQPRTAMHRLGFLRSNRIVLASNSWIAVEKAKAMLN